METVSHIGLIAIGQEGYTNRVDKGSTEGQASKDGICLATFDEKLLNKQKHIYMHKRDCTT